jgi:hypothetical protein
MLYRSSLSIASQVNAAIMGLFVQAKCCKRVNGYSIHAIPDVSFTRVVLRCRCGRLWSFELGFLMVRRDNLWGVCLKTLKLKRSEQMVASENPYLQRR